MTISQQVQQIRQLTLETANRCSRDPRTIHLLAVSKGQPASAIREAFLAGVTNFGENYWQEAQSKMTELADLPLTWHFTGPIQSNKAMEIAGSFSWVHSLCRDKIALLLSRHRPQHLPSLNVCIQINLDCEAGKAGIDETMLTEFALFVGALPGLRLRGLMAIPRPQVDETLQYEGFRRLARLLEETNLLLPVPMDTLSMGMSADMIPAIRAGSTWLRIGRAIFGERGSSLS